jgi:phage shock protein A
MGILQRVSTLVQSNMNAVIDKMTDPGKEIDQLVRDMESEARRAREEALRANEESLARQALERKAEIDDQVKEAGRGVEEQSMYVDQLAEALRKLDARVQEVKSKKETLKAKARANAGRGPLNTSAFDDFDRASDRIEAVEAEAAIDEELAAARHEDAHSLEVERKLAELDRNQEIEDRLAALKAKLDKK